MRRPSGVHGGEGFGGAGGEVIVVFAGRARVRLPTLRDCRITRVERERIATRNGSIALVTVAHSARSS